MARNTRGGTRSERRETRKDKRGGYGAVVPARPRTTEFVTPMRERQKLLVSSCISRILTFVTGPAGTGKSHVIIGTALSLLLKGILDQIVITKPFFEIDEKLGPLPGDEGEKTAVQFRAARNMFTQFIGKGMLDCLEKSGKIKFEHLGSILGTTFDNAFMIMEEAQNTTPNQMRAFLSRKGRNTKIAIIGDYLEQKFVEGRCGLEDALWRFEGNDNVGFVDFEVEDIVRDDFVKDIILAYRKTKRVPDAKLQELPNFMTIPAN